MHYTFNNLTQLFNYVNNKNNHFSKYNLFGYYKLIYNTNIPNYRKVWISVSDDGLFTYYNRYNYKSYGFVITNEILKENPYWIKIKKYI